MPANTLEVLERALAGAELDAEAGAELLRSTDLAALGLAADALRRRLVPERTATYLPGQHLVYARSCIATCPWCHPLPPGRNQSAPLGIAQAAEAAAAAVAAGAAEIILQGAHAPVPYGYYLGLLRAVREACPGVPLAGFSTSEVTHMARIGGRSVETVLGDLRQAGLTLLCSAALEPLGNQVLAAQAALVRGEGLDVLAHAAAAGMPVLAVLRFGIGETPVELARYLTQLGALQSATGCLVGVHLWADSRGEEEPEGDLLQLEPKGGGGVTGFEYLRTVAVTRLMLPGVAHVTASWHSQGAKISQIALGMGADDLGSLYLTEPHAVELAASVHGPFTAEVVERLARDAGLAPVRRPSFARPA